MNNDFADTLKAFLIIVGFLVLIIVLPLSAQHSIATDCDDFGKFRAAGNVYTCEKIQK